MRAPKYRRHSTRDIGFIEFRGKRHYFPGGYRSVESQAGYKAFLRENVLADSPLPAQADGPAGITIARLVLTYLEYAKQHYGESKRGEYGNMRASLLPLAEIHGADLAANFGPLKLKAYRQSLIVGGKSRGYINSTIGRIKRAFKWATSEELIPASVSHGLATVPGLSPGRTAAKEPPKRQPVPWSHVEPVLAELGPTVRAMVLFQWHTGARSQSICLATPSQFTVESDGLWLWRPRHKSEFRGKLLVLPIGPRAIEAITPFIACGPDNYLFDPRRTRKNRRYGKRYTTVSYYRAVERAIDRVNKDRVDKIPNWTPHQIRHSKGHSVREKHGIEAAQAVLGHATMDATEIYSAARVELAKAVARDSG